MGVFVGLHCRARLLCSCMDVPVSFQGEGLEMAGDSTEGVYGLKPHHLSPANGNSMRVPTPHPHPACSCPPKQVGTGMHAGLS